MSSVSFSSCVTCHPSIDPPPPSPASVPTTKAMSSTPREASTVKHPQDIKVPSLFSLPRELRDMIYRFILGEEAEYCQSRECHAWEQDLEFNAFIHRENLWPTCDRFNIARTCWIAYEEANQVIYRNNIFRFRVMSKTWLRPWISQKNAKMLKLCLPYSKS